MNPLIYNSTRIPPKVKFFIASILSRRGFPANRRAPGPEKDRFPRLLSEGCRSLVQDVRSDPATEWIGRFQQGADPRERPVGPAEPIYGIEVHDLEYSKANAKKGVMENPSDFN